MSLQALYGETLLGMKKAIKRKAYDSDSDSSIEQLTNRGNKLRKKARYVHEGQLAPPTGPGVYKKTIEHAGFPRDIISLNPPLVDEDGYEVDSEDDDERAQAAIAAAAEFDPYADVKIEHLLAPLTSASDLPDHPTLSKPFLSKTLTDLTRNAGEMVQKERASLWRMKHLLTRLSGDHTWIPCASVETDNDFALFIDERDLQRAKQLGKSIAKDDGDELSAVTFSNEESQAPMLMITEGENPKEGTPEKEKTAIEETIADRDVAVISTTEETTDANNNRTGASMDANDAQTAEGVMDVDGAAGPGSETNIENQVQALETSEGVAEAGEDDQEDLPAPRRMRTRAQAASDNVTNRTRSATPDSNMESFIHPYFLTPAKSHPDRDLGLPQHEAEETRRLLQLYVQKQEEVCRGAQRVYDGLLRANRYRHLIMKWAKAEAHVGINRDMSDGEDWYDKEEWGLDEDLKKGQDEEEEDAATTAKKTRTRRQ